MQQMQDETCQSERMELGPLGSVTHGQVESCYEECVFVCSGCAHLESYGAAVVDLTAGGMPHFATRSFLTSTRKL